MSAPELWNNIGYIIVSNGTRRLPSGPKGSLAASAYLELAVENKAFTLWTATPFISECCSMREYLDTRPVLACYAVSAIRNSIVWLSGGFFLAALHALHAAALWVKMEFAGASNMEIVFRI